MASLALLSLFVIFFFCLVVGSTGMSSETAQCSKMPVIFNFGDSNSDTGGGAVLIALDGGEGRLFFPHPTGRICDGRLILDFLCESLGSKYLRPYFQLSASDFSNGVNFALAGSDTLRQQEFLTVLRTQVNYLQFFRNMTRSSYIDDDQFKSALYMLDIGQNDLTGAFQKYPTIDGVLRLIPVVVANIGDAIRKIYQLGGRNFWVHNTGPLGCLPVNIMNASSSSLLDNYGCVAEKNRAAKEFNGQLKSLCEELRSEMEGSTIVYVDIFSIKLDIIANYSSYGFEEKPWRPCKSSVLVCPVGSRRVFWDVVHYTEAANAIVASQIASNHFSTPPLPLNFFCN